MKAREKEREKEDESQRNPYLNTSFEIECVSCFYLNLSEISCLSLSDTPLDIRKPCEPSPCGFNAICRENNGVGSCTCLPDYLGDPYEGCRPECTQNSDCPTRMACVGLKCRDPCPGTCGVNAQCQSINHLPICTCIPGYTGNPFMHCSPIIEDCKLYFHIRYFIVKVLFFPSSSHRMFVHNVKLYWKHLNQLWFQTLIEKNFLFVC